MENKPNILIVIGSDFLGSPEKMIIKQMKYLTGFNFVCASFVKQGADNELLRLAGESGYGVEAIEDNFLFDPKIPSRIKSLIERHNISLLISHGYKANFYTLLTRTGSKIPRLAYFHGWTQEDVKMIFYNLIDKIALRRIKSIIAVSRANADRLIKIGVKEDRIHVVYNAIEIDDGSLSFARSPNEKPIIGVVSRLSREKGVHVFIRALARIIGDADDFAAEIYGHGGELDNLKKLAVELNIYDIVRFMGFSNDIDRVYGRLDFLVLPSLSEGHPLVILEAWKHHLGIIAARVGGIPEVIDDGIDGILVDSDDPHKLGDAILQALRDRERMNAMGNAGYAKLKEKYSYDIQAGKLTGIINSLIEESHSGENSI